AVSACDSLKGSRGRGEVPTSRAGRRPARRKGKIMVRSTVARRPSILRAPGCVAALGALALLACKGPDAAGHGEGPKGPVVAISHADLAYGFPAGGSSGKVAVAPFQISTNPVTVAQYRACVAGNACTPPSSQANPCTAPHAGTLLRATYSTED